MDSRGKQANFGRDTGPPGDNVSSFNDMVEDEWRLICLKEKVGEIGPKVLEIWIVKGGVGDDADECDGSEEKSDGSGFEWYGSGEESNGSDEDYNSEDLVNINVHDDEEFVKNVDVTTEFSGLSNVQPQQGDGVNYSDEGNLVGSDGEVGGVKWQKFLKDLEDDSGGGEERRWWRAAVSGGRSEIYRGSGRSSYVWEVSTVVEGGRIAAMVEDGGVATVADD
nr:uncharacterized protein LOC109185271 [Ipomoea trifida]